MTGFVGEDGKQVILERSLIYAQMLANVVWNQYPVAGLHRQGSKAVQCYTMLELKDRFALMCAAFGEEQYKVDETLKYV